MSWHELVQYLWLLLPCILFSAVCVVGKFSFVQLHQEYIEELVKEGDTKASFLLKLYSNPAKFLGMAQLGVAASAMICGALLFYVLYGLWTPLLQILPLWAVLVLYTVAVIAASLLLWVFGELIPKSIGLQEAE